MTRSHQAGTQDAAPSRAAVVAAFALAGILASACGPGDGSARAQEPGDVLAPPVEALPARSGALPLEERVSGIVRSENQVMLRPEIEAPIVEVYVRSGEAVRAGQPLVRLLDDTVREQMRQAEAAVRLAEAAADGARARVAELRAQVVRTRSLAEQDLVSDLEVETQEAQLAAAEAAASEAAARVEEARATVEERRSRADRTVVRAPVTGHVGRRDAEVGMLADPSTPLFVLGNLDALIVEIPLTEVMLARLEVGMPVRISSPVLSGGAVTAELSRISPFLDADSFSTTAEIDLDNPGGLRPGMFVTVDVLYGETDRATLIPTSALWEHPRTGRRGVFVIDDPAGLDPPAESGGTGELGHEARPVEFRPVEIVAEGRGTVGIRGLDPGTWVVTVGQHLLPDEGEARARVRPTSWARVLELQGLQREDLLEQFLEEQRAWARERGAEPPDNAEFARGSREGSSAGR